MRLGEPTTRTTRTADAHRERGVALGSVIRMRAKYPKMSSSMHSYLRTSLSLALSVVGLGCSAVVDASRAQCKTTADCTSRGAEFASSVCENSMCVELDPWSCTDHPTPTPSSSMPVAVDFSLMDPITQGPIVGVNASLCGKLDVDCQAPMATTKSDADGIVRLDVAPLFDGFVLLSAQGRDPTMVFLPAAVEPVSLGTVPLTTPLVSDGLGATLGVKVNSEKGRVLVTTTGCDRQPVGGVTVVGDNMGDDAARFYAVGGLPTFSEPSTDASGFAGFINVEPGQVTIHASLEDGTAVGRVGLIIRAGYVSVRRIQPWTD